MTETVYLFRIFIREKRELLLHVEWTEKFPGTQQNWLSVGGTWECGQDKWVTQSVAFTGPNEVTIICGEPSYE